MAAASSRIQKSDSAFRSIGEAAAELNLPTHVLRYWESKFPRQIKPVKRADGRRMFRAQDIDALRAIQTLVHQRGMTLKGAKALLGEQGIDAVLAGEATLGGAAIEARNVTSPARELQTKVAAAFDAKMDETEAPSSERLQSILIEMTDIKRRLDAARIARAA